MSSTAVKRIVIAGAASLRGEELAESLGNGEFAASDLRGTAAANAGAIAKKVLSE